MEMASRGPRRPLRWPPGTGTREQGRRSLCSTDTHRLPHAAAQCQPPRSRDGVQTCLKQR